MTIKQDTRAREIPPETTAKNLISLVVWVLGILCLLNLGLVIYFENAMPNYGYSRVRNKWNMLLDLEDPVDWLILGDSSAHHSVVPGIFRESLSESAINLGTIGELMVVNDAWMLETYIEKFGAPKHVVIVRSYFNWGDGFNISAIEQIPVQWDRLQKFQPSTNFTPVEKSRFFVTRNFPLYSQNLSLGGMIKNPWNLFRAKETEYLKDGFQDGYSANPENVRQQADIFLKGMSQNPKFHLSEINQKAIEHIGYLGTIYDFDVFIVNGPIYEGLYPTPPFNIYFSQMHHELAQYTARYSKVHFLMGEPMTFPATEMEAAVHVSQTGAYSYTQRIIADITDLNSSE